MPTYEYACSKCGHHFEKIQSINDKSLTVCPKELCAQKKWGKGKVKRVISAGGGLLFKGSGFYITDYRSEKYKEAAKKDTATLATPASDKTSPAPAPAKTPATSEKGSPSSDKAKTSSAKAESKPSKAASK